MRHSWRVGAVLRQAIGRAFVPLAEDHGDAEASGPCVELALQARG
jgi:hypothetical protein